MPISSTPFLNLVWTIISFGITDETLGSRLQYIVSEDWVSASPGHTYLYDLTFRFLTRKKKPNLRDACFI